MTNKTLNTICLTLIFIIGIGIQYGFSQSSGEKVQGVITESGTNKPLKQVSISITSTGEVTDTNEEGFFTITVPTKQLELSIYLPGYHKRQIFINGNDILNISLVPLKFISIDNPINKPLGVTISKNEIYSSTSIKGADVELNNITSFEQALQGMIPGLQITNQSGLPGQKSWINMRGLKSIYGKNEPLLIIDGMIHDYNYANEGIMEGFTLNPFEIIDIEDIADISVFKNGDSHLGAAASNGVIYVNTQQKSEASTLIKISGSVGVSLMPKKQKTLNGPQFTDYVKGLLNQQGASTDEIRTELPWLFGEGDEKYRYGNNTNWQNEIYTPGILQKYHIFLKGGDEIATYNISTGLINHDGSIAESGFNRFNLRINGLVNITSKFSVVPNFKLSLTDTYVPNLGPTYQHNPILSSILKAPIMSPYFIDNETGLPLNYIDDLGAFGYSNPVKIIEDATGTNRNYHFSASVKVQYNFNKYFTFTNLVGLNFNNARENIFIPNKGIGKINLYIENSPMDFIYEYRSIQNHAILEYKKELEKGKSINIQSGFRYMKNSYQYNKAIDLNTASDDFKNLGSGGNLNYLRQSLGDNRGLLWMSYFINGNYNIKNKYFFNANVSADANSAVNDNNRINIYPSIGAAWRLSSERFMNNNKSIDDLKLRLSYSESGNMYSSIYDYSKLYYNEKRMNTLGVPVREAIPNKNLELEKNSVINLGMDLTTNHQTLNMHFDAYYSMINNLIIEQEIAPIYGYTSYFDNGGQLSNMGVELAVDYRKNFGDIVWTIGGTVTGQTSVVNKLNFLKQDVTSIITSIPHAEYITSEGNPINAFYGYQTNGIYSNNDEASKVIGPKGKPMQAGDIRFKGDEDGVIDNNDKTIIGNPNPDIFGGLFSSVFFQNWEINATFNYSIGNDIFNYTRYIGESMSNYGNQFATILDSWSENNSNGLLPRTSIGDPTGNTVFSDRWIEDGSYLKLKNLTVSYTLPNSKIYSGIKIYLSASNLFTLTKYSGNDPEFYYLNNPFYMGTDYGKTPQSRSFIVGVKLDL
ncbi:MAG TPA: SusC/RagA family TonB-linked outer membrane protein [Prolixibacteraceae bacterium]|nr:SusC/RagA family TonB-linked outer membrane protein [Prolixibacteraceae bacterium]